MNTLQNPPPQLEDRIGPRTFSRWAGIGVPAALSPYAATLATFGLLAAPRRRSSPDPTAARPCVPSLLRRRSMREVVAQCLQKDPSRRPSARALLEHRFLKSHARDKAYLVKHLLAGGAGHSAC